MSAWAKVGAKCVCIKRGQWSVVKPGARLDTVCPSFGEICVIEEVSEGFLRLRGYGEFYTIRRFRPLITRTQSEDVALFRKLLVTEGADA